MKTIVTHTSPDEDALCSVWLVKRFFPGWAGADVTFVPAGSTLDKLPPDDDPDVVHVDTGLGQFDHHETGDRSVCASVKVLQFVVQNHFVTDPVQLSALSRMVAIVLQVDHALERTWPDPENDRYDFFPESVFDGLKAMPKSIPNDELIQFGMKVCDGIFWNLQKKVLGEADIKRGTEFTTPWGKGIGMETINDRAHVVAERMGYQTVVLKDPTKGNVRIYAHPFATNADLGPVYEEIHRRDPNSNWFLHASKRLLLNGSRSNPVARPTKLSLREIIGIIESLI